MAEKQDTLAALSLAEKRILLSQLLQEKANQSAARGAGGLVESVGTAQVGGVSLVFPLSQGQRGLWFLHQMDPRSPAYNICYATRIRSPIDLPALRRAMNQLVQRHPCLRTTFEEREGLLLQRVHDEMPLHFESSDAHTWDDATLRRRLEAEANRPFDLERGPLLRMHVFTRAPDEHIALVAIHHIIGDFWSLVLLIQDLQALYPAECAGGASPGLRLPATHYGDFVRWQAELLAGPEGERLFQYWERQLAGAPTILELPSDRPRPLVFARRGGGVPVRIGPGLARGLKELAAVEGVTLYSVLLGAFQVLIGRYTEQEDFLIGSPFAGRTRPGFGEVVGYFINMVPLRADLSGDPSFRTLLRRVSATVLDALQHQDYPFALLVERLRVTRDLSRTPLVQVTFTLEKTHRSLSDRSSNGAAQDGVGPVPFLNSRAKLSVGGLDVEQYYIEQHVTQCDLELVMEEGDGALEGMVRYNSDLFEAATVERMVGHYLTLLKGVAEDPDQRLSDLPWLSEAEHRQVIHEWNRTELDFPDNLCLHHLFEQQASRTPEAVALSSDTRSVTYAELETWSSRLATRLRRLGAGPGVLVALCLERSPEMIAAMLGTLKAGAAFVPLDPATPSERLRLILADTRAPLMLAQYSLHDRLAPIVGDLCHLLDEDAGIQNPNFETRSSESEIRNANVTANDLAYVIYTSGSTGRPKGVMIEHGAICNTVFARQRNMPIRADDSVLYQLSYTFDASLCIIFPTLAAGARLVLAAPGEEYDPHRLVERVVREQVTILQVPPAPLRLMLADPLLKTCRAVRWVCTGGETMPPDLPSLLSESLDVELYNLYGPTEAAVDTTWWSCRGASAGPIPIGRPIANVQVYVLDANRRPLPVGLPGDLYVGGAGLARGYLNDPGLTAERFIADPFRKTPGARLYRTGDRCRWRADGAVEFLGRRDHQVKLRGYRVELGEVEAALMSHPAVREAAVICIDSDTRLIAYVACNPEYDAPNSETLRRHLKERLPEYMIPATFVTLPSLPRTSGGKVNRQALPAPQAERPSLAQPYQAPRTALEEYLVGLWRELLHVDRVGLDDNFFELGGTSILGAMMISRLQEKLGQRVSVAAVFDAPTIAGLAGQIEQSGVDVSSEQFRSSNLPLVVPLQPEGSRSPWFMVHPPGGIVVCYQALAQRLGRDRPFYGIRARGLHGEAELPMRMEDMAAEYVAGVRAIQPRGPYQLGGWSVGGLVAWEMAQQLRARGERISLLALVDTSLPASARQGDEQSGQEYGLDITLAELSRLGPDEQLPYLWQHALKLGLIEPGVPMEVAEQILHDLKRLFHHHMQLADRYVARPYPHAVTLVRPTDVPFASAMPRDRGWKSLAAAVEVQFVPGHHHSMVKEPHVEALARTLEDCLQRAEFGARK
jgi:amino acid adenylation domain-containing protein